MDIDPTKSIEASDDDLLRPGSPEPAPTTFPTSDDPALAEFIAARREGLIAERKAALTKLLDEHDSLVREAFHLERFVTLVSYDPEIAKTDASPVFEAYRARFDLVANNLEASSDTGALSRRTTRRAVNDTRKSISTPVAQKNGTESRKRTISSVTARGKGKVRQSLPAASSSAAQSLTRPSSPDSDASSRPRKRSRQSLPSTSTLASDEPSTPMPVKRKPGRPRKSALPASSNGILKGSEISSQPDSSAVPSITPAKRRVGRPRKVVPLPVEVESEDDELSAKGAPTETNGVLHSSPNMAEQHNSSSPPRPRLPKRIRLIARLPPVTYTHPEQIPPRPLHSHKLSELMRSYTQLEDDAPPMLLDALQTEAEKEAELRRRVATLRAEGRFTNMQGHVEEQDEPTRTMTYWDHVIQETTSRLKIVRDGGKLRVAGSKRVAKLIAAYWEKAAGAEEKRHKAEERRMQGLVRSTMKAVTTQWKDAVRYVRMKKAEEQKAEQARLGKEHLDAIIERSAQALQAQRGRRDSRSASRARSSLSRASSSSGTSEDSEDDDSEDDEEQDDDLLTNDAHEGPIDILVPQDATIPSSKSAVRPSVEPSVSSLSSRRVSFAHTPNDPLSGDDLPISPRTDVSRGKSLPHHSPKGSSLDASSSSPSPLEFQPLAPDSSSLPDPTPLPVREADDDDDFQAVVDDDAEDHQMELTMEAEESDTDDEEINGLGDDANMPLDELMRRYGYVPVGEAGDDDANDDDEEEGEEGEEEEEEEGNEEAVVVKPNGLNGVESEDVPTAENEAIQMESTSTSPTIPLLNDIAPPEAKVLNGVPLSTSPNPPSIEIDPLPALDMTLSIIDPVSITNGAVSENDDEAISDVESVKSAISFRAASPSHELEPDTVTVKPPFLLRGTLRPYQQAGLEWLVSLYLNDQNGILADEMGLGKTIQTIALLAYLACEKGIWGPHIIIVPTSVLKNWEMEFKKFLPGFKIVAYYGNSRERRERRQGWKTPNAFNVCITSYQLILADQHIFRRMPWVYMILDEAHNIKNFKSQRWQDLFTFQPRRRLLLTGTPLQNNLLEIWALMSFLNPIDSVGYLSDFATIFSRPMDRAIEDGRTMDSETQETVMKLHAMLRPYLLRRMKADVEKELPAKYEHLVYCRLSKRQRFLYDEFMSRASTKETLASGNFLSVVNCLMQLRKVCNHPDLFEVRPIVTSFAMTKSAAADFEIKELFVRRRLLQSTDMNFLDTHSAWHITARESHSLVASESRRSLDASHRLPHIHDLPGEPPPHDVRTIIGYKRYHAFRRAEAQRANWIRMSRVNRERCAQQPIYGSEVLNLVQTMHAPLAPLGIVTARHPFERVDLVHAMIRSHSQRATDMKGMIDHFAFATPNAVALDMPSQALRGCEEAIEPLRNDPQFDAVLHTPAVKLQVAFPDAFLLQYDCGKLQELARLLRDREAGGHRVLIFTQMTKVLDILEIFLNLHGWRYLRLDGSTKIEERQRITTRFNMDTRILAFISSSRSGGVGINLTGADTVIFYDSDFNPSMDRQCEDRAHRIGQIRDVHIYRFISLHTVEESMLRKANQKRSLDDLVIRQGDFDWRQVTSIVSDMQMEQALAQVEDVEDAVAARDAAREMEGESKDVQQEFDESNLVVSGNVDGQGTGEEEAVAAAGAVGVTPIPAEDELASSDLSKIEQYMIRFVERDWAFFSEWRTK